jgi:hypothetical protein
MELPSARDRRVPLPDTYKGPVTDTYFGTTVPDPYRWLEADVRNSDSVATWVESEDKIARDYLAALPQRRRSGHGSRSCGITSASRRPTRRGIAISSRTTTACRTRR